MHVLLKDVLQHELSQILFNLIVTKKLFSLKRFNSGLAGFHYILTFAAKPILSLSTTISGMVKGT